MKLRHLHLSIVAQLICIIATQNNQSYDTSDWIPVTQKSGEENIQRKATARVLNLDSPSQKFFPEELNYKKSRPNFQSRPKHKDRYNVPKYESTYKFELPPSLPQTGGPKFQYFPKHEAQLPSYQHSPYRPPPLPQYVQNPQTIVGDRLPSSNIPKNIQQFNIPFNSTSYYQTISPVSINQELTGNIQFQDPRVQYQSPSGVGIQYPGAVVNQNPNGAFNKGALQQNKQAPRGRTQGDIEKESVQLVYVPLENLREKNQLIPQGSQTNYKQIESPKYENPLGKQHRLAVIEQDFIEQALQATKLQEQIQHGDPLLYQISTTPKPIKKRKPHQPPLAVYVEGEHQQVALSNVLEALKDAKSITVQDSIQSDSPQIFIGPSTLESPEYSKFPLPYLNGIDGNRLNRNIENLPFFVAPLSFKAPPGFSKIPLPAPHVGSVVISNREELSGKQSTIKPNQFSESNIKQISSTTPKSNYNSLNIQPYIGQSYYEPVQFVSSPQPQLLQFAVNDKQQEFSLPSYNKKSEKTEYYQPSKQQSNIETEGLNTKNPTKPSFQYSYIDEIATGTTPTSNGETYSDLGSSYSVPSRNPTYTSPQAIFDQERINTPSYQQYTEDRKNQKKIEDSIRYEPIATTFEGASRGQQEEIVNIKPKTEIVTQLPTRQNEEKNSRLPDVNPLELAINEYELHEINTQLEEKPRIKNQNNYKTNPSQNEEDIDYRYQNSYKPRPNQRDEHIKNQNRQRIRPSQNDENTEYRFDPELHRFSSTPLSILRDSYVETTTKPTTKQRGRVRARPTTTTTTTTTVQPEHYTVLEDFYLKDKSTPQYTQPTNTQYVAQTNVQIEPVRTQQKSGATQYSDSITEIENIPTNVYTLNPDQNVYTEKAPIGNPQTSNQDLMDRQILNRQNSDKYEQQEQFYEQGQFETSPHTSQYTSPSQEQQQIPYDQKTIHYTDPFEDPSVRSLLIPNLLVPTTTNSIYSGPSYLPTTEKIVSTTTTTTTEKPAEATPTTTPYSRTRSRTRGGNRHSESSTTKRPVSRRRPTNTRVTTERTKYPIEVEYSTRSSNSKQRFRSRGHTTPNSITERLSTTENEEVHPVPSSDTPLNLRTHPDGSESYMQYEQIIDQKSEEPVLTVDYPKYHITSTRPILQYENTASSPKPVLNVQVTHPIETYQYSQEETPKVKVRSRIRDRPRITSTTTEKQITRKVVSPKPVEKEESEEEFFGFFRQPNFGPPTNSKTEITTTPAPPRIYTYQTPSQHREDHRVPDNIDSSTVRFVGEIVPKFTSKEVETETPKPRIRTRTRPKPSHQDRSEETTKRYTISRSRGKTHYRVPENLKKNVDEEAEVEGGNYPQYFQEKRGVTTPRPEFQITVAPEEDEDDQAPHSSINRPNVVASPEEWHDVSLLENINDDKTHGNVIDKQRNQPSNNRLPEQPASSDQPYALPVKSSLEENSTDSSEERFRKTSKQIEEQFEAINSFNDQNRKEEEKKKRRKGIWKLVKQRPIDRLETSESQNYFSVLNSYHDIKKVEGLQERYQKPDYVYLRGESVIDPQYNTENNNSGPVNNNVESNMKAGELNAKNLQDKIEKNSVTEETTTNKEYVTDYEKFSTITTTPVTEYTTKAEDFIDSIYEMFGMARDTSTQEPTTSTVTEMNSEPTTVTTTPNPTFPEEITETTSSTYNVTEPSTETTTLQDFFTTVPVVEKKQENKMLPFEIEPWDMRAIRTSTSTEVSHETEICYRGRCVRSSDRKKRFK